MCENEKKSIIYMSCHIYIYELPMNSLKPHKSDFQVIKIKDECLENKKRKRKCYIYRYIDLSFLKVGEDDCNS